MSPAIVRAGASIIFLSLLQACGGGDGDGGNGPDPRLSLGQAQLSVQATPGETPPVESVSVTVSNPPASTVTKTVEWTGDEIQSVVFVTQDLIEIRFLSAAMLPNGTYDGTITIHACLDAQCTDEIQGSPATLATHYEVSGTGTSVATFDRTIVQPVAYRDEQVGILETVTLTIQPRPETDFIILSEGAPQRVATIRHRTINDVTTAIDLTYYPGQQLPGGVHRDDLTVTVCYEPSCIRQVDGSPFSIRSDLTVDPPSERGLAHLAVSGRTALMHDVVDAEFSKALNSIVMVSNYPSNTLHVFDVQTGVERDLALNKRPFAVSISPDGLTAAVGHDALVTIVDLTTVGQPAPPAPILLNVTSDVQDVVLDGNGYVHVFPATDQWTQPRSIEIATNVEALGSHVLRAGSNARLLPGGDTIYVADNGVSTLDIERWDISTGVATFLYDSPYFGEYGMCGNVWFDEGGTRIFTPCGNTFGTSDDPAQDMVYAGAMELGNTDIYSVFIIVDLSHNAATGEIALVEQILPYCGTIQYDDPCYTHLAFHEDQFLNRQAVYSIRPLRVDDVDYLQRGLFAFHDATTTRKYLLSRLPDVPDADAAYYLSTIE